MSLCARRVSQLRCPADYSWLQQQLATRNLKAYKADISVHDPKQRKVANEVSDWCAGDAYKLWSTTENRYVPFLNIDGRRLRSVPTKNA